MREDELVGYCLGALDEGDSRQVELALADPVQGPDLRRNLELIRTALRPLDRDRGPIAPTGGRLHFLHGNPAIMGPVARPGRRLKMRRRAPQCDVSRPLRRRRHPAMRAERTR